MQPSVSIPKTPSPSSWLLGGLADKGEKEKRHAHLPHLGPPSGVRGAAWQLSDTPSAPSHKFKVLSMIFNSLQIAASHAQLSLAPVLWQPATI